ncbi:MAG: DNA adenine methylase [Actinomycetota bacterium]|nr:DNA adenine methylase [Actinomycetota bacterium]
MIKYLGSKRRLVPVLGELLSRCGAVTAIDLFTGTTRVAQEFKRRGAEVWALDSARYSGVLAECYVATDGRHVDVRELGRALEHLDALPGRAGYVTETFCRRSRFFQPFNGERIDAIRDGIEREFRLSPLYPILLTSLLEAADRVDSTTGVQMAYLKAWAPRSFAPIRLRKPVLLPGPGHADVGDALSLAGNLPEVDLAYIDPPYNQHRYFTNYHIWETVIAWDRPEHYGVACKRVDAREPHTRSTFNARRSMAPALERVIRSVRARVALVSISDESWLSLRDLVEMCSPRGSVEVLTFDSRRYVGAQIGIFDPRGKRVGRVSHLRNLEHVVVSGDPSDVREIAGAAAAASPAAASV